MRPGEQTALFEKAKKARERRRGGVALGRKPHPQRLGFVPHATRAEHDRRHPVHVSIRRVPRAPSLRSERIFRAILVQLARAKRPTARGREGVQVVHYSVQHDHLHLIVESKDRHDLAAQMRKLFSRIALAVNGLANRRGSLFRDRHHREELDSPTKTRERVVYVLFNDRKHHAQNGGAINDARLSELDDRSSAAWLDGDDWHERARPPPEPLPACARATATSTASARRARLRKRGSRERAGARGAVAACSTSTSCRASAPKVAGSAPSRVAAPGCL